MNRKLTKVQPATGETGHARGGLCRGVPKDLRGIKHAASGRGGSLQCIAGSRASRPGTAFRGLWQGSTQLLAGRDYTVSGSRLTLTTTALTRLTGNRAYGVNSTLQARFSRGLPWSIDIVTNDAPVLSNSTGTADVFTIPTQYRGDALAGMEATYADGSNAGPISRNPYQEFNQAFSPDYPGGTTILTPAFLAAQHDNAPVKLTFHYYSGATVTYHVTKSGGSVTGTTS
ncbi:hypothetical protein G3I60_04610 [Streptomyces sp. SID13666]|nr:hypothetical protein [Streptomyces sp. SID13666]NEA69218.1 hypothetical protein [Streptomyces sp. SID13588]